MAFAEALKVLMAAKKLMPKAEKKYDYEELEKYPNDEATNVADKYFVGEPESKDTESLNKMKWPKKGFKAQGFYEDIDSAY